MTGPKTIKLTIDGKPCEGVEGQTILGIASANQIAIPTLCYLKHLSSWGGCRMCIVEIQGSPKIAPACSTPAVDGSVVTTNSERLVNLRRFTLELLFSERNHICPFCVMNQRDCELQVQGYRHGMDSIRFPYLYPALPVDVSARHFGIDHNRCILCTRCVRTCDEIEGVHTLDISNRGMNNRVVADLGMALGAAETCTSCGACVAACPTGALFDKAAAYRGKLNSCQIVRTTCSECPVGCGLLVYTKENRIVDVFGDPDSPISRGHLCVRGRYETWAEPRERILQPMIRKGDALQPATWEQARNAIVNALKDLHSSQKATLVSPRLTNETAAALKAIAKTLGRVGVFVASNEESFLGSNGEKHVAAADLSQLDKTDAILILGAQPSRSQGVVAAKIRHAVRKRGAKLLIFHARKSDLDGIADIAANVVSLEHVFWDRVAEVLRDVQHPVLLYGPNAMTPIGVTVLEKLIHIFETKKNGQPPRQIGLPTSTNARSLAAARLEMLEEVGPWIDEHPLKFLHIVASDEPDGGARLLDEKYVSGLLENIGCLVVQASYRSPLSDRATVVLPAAIWCERSGTITNLEDKDLPLQRVVPPLGEARDDKTILEALYS